MQPNPQKSTSLALHISKEANEFLENFAKELQIPDSRYEEAQNRYQSVGKWLC